MAEHPHAQLVRKGYEAFTRGDMDTLRTLMSADCTHHVPGSHPLSGAFKGQDAISETYGRLAEETGATLAVGTRSMLVAGPGHAARGPRGRDGRRGRRS